MLADQCADPGIFARGVQARLPENSSDDVFFSFLSSFFTVFQEGPTFSRGGVKLFSGGGVEMGSPNANYRNP